MKISLARLLPAGLLLTALGCCNTPSRPVWQSQPVAPAAPWPVAPVSPVPGPPPGAMQPAPAPYPVVQPTTAVPPPAPPANTIPTVPPAAAPNTSGAAIPPGESIARVENRWQPSDKGVHLGAPEPITSADSKTPPRLYPPDKTAEPPLNQSSTALPVGIPQFATAMDNVATGLRPSLDDGLDWLQARGYRAVLYVRLPEEADAADRKQVEKRGMKYLTLEVSAPTLTKEVVQEFSRIVRDTSSQPLFVYDRDGSLAGSLWYLYFRTVEHLGDDVARVRAGALGLRENRNDAHRAMWLAVQKYLSENQP
jgi:protein tyrosine phosphatase (PTP) superfamily phosphohydrolase (DUF442 family)